MMVSMWQAVKISFGLIRKDVVTVVPFFTMFLILQTVTVFFAGNVKDFSLWEISGIAVVGGVVLDTIAKLLTMSMMMQLQQAPLLDGRSVWQVFKKSFFSLLIATLLLVLPLVGVLMLLVSDTKEPDLYQMIINLLVLSGVIYVGFIVQMLPIFSVMESRGVFRSLKETFLFVNREFRFVFRYMMMMFFLGFMSLFLGLYFSQIPIIGKAVFEAFIQGVFYTVIYGVMVVAYAEFKRQSQGSLVDHTRDDVHSA